MKKNFINKKDNFLVLTFGLLPSTLASPEAPLDPFSRGKQQNKTKNSQMKTQILCGVSVSYKKKKQPQPPQNQKKPKSCLFPHIWATKLHLALGISHFLLSPQGEKRRFLFQHTKRTKAICTKNLRQKTPNTCSTNYYCQTST